MRALSRVYAGSSTWSSSLLFALRCATKVLEDLHAFKIGYTARTEACSGTVAGPISRMASLLTSKSASSALRFWAGR